MKGMLLGCQQWFFPLGEGFHEWIWSKVALGALLFGYMSVRHTKPMHNDSLQESYTVSSFVDEFFAREFATRQETNHQKADMRPTSKIDLRSNHLCGY